MESVKITFEPNRNWERISSFVYCVYSILIFIIVSFFIPFAGLRECFTFLLNSDLVKGDQFNIEHKKNGRK